MNDLTPGERTYADLAAEGVTIESLLEEMRAKPTFLPDGVIGVTVLRDGEPVEITLTTLVRVPNLRTAFAQALANQARGMQENSFTKLNECLVPFIDFLVESERAGIKPRHITNGTLNDYRDRLDDYEKPQHKPFSERKASKSAGTVFPTEGGGKLKVETKIAWMTQILNVLRAVRVDPDYWMEINRELDLVRGTDWSSVANDRTPVEILTRPQLKILVRICREEVTETSRRLKAAWAVMDGQASDLDERSQALLLEVKALHDRFGGKPPKQQALASALGDDKVSFPILRRLKSEPYNAALSTIYPTGRLLMPFILLFAIYYRYNRSVVTTLAESTFSEQPSVHGGTRLRGMPFKNRAGRTQYASWPVTKDPDNPAEMIETLRRWTGLVRERANDRQMNHMFLERGRKSKVRSMAETWVFDVNFVRFLVDHEAKIQRRFFFRAIRPSVINLVHHLFDGDLLATAEAGQHQVRTMVDHYLFDGARKRNEEALIPAMHLREAWRVSGGKDDAREDKRVGDMSAATPGFSCKDRYDGRMQRKRPDDLCTAYGMCPNCRLGQTDVNSPEAYALVVKLREAVIRARPRMPAETWIGRWSAVLDKLDLETIDSFTDEAKQRADLGIPDLPTVE